jgi:hypothetical protein
LFPIPPYNDYATAIAVDLFVLAGCTILLLRYGRLAHSHPGIAYLFFHMLIVSSRILAILAGAETLFSSWGGIFEPVTEFEIVRAAFLADVVLVMMTIAWIRASIIDTRLQSRKNRTAEAQPITLSLAHIWSVVAIAFPIGLIGIALLGNVPGIEKPQIDLGEWQESSWVSITMTWAGLALLVLIYWYGFRWWLVAPMGIHLFIMGIQGYHRFRVIIPLILLLQIYLDRKQKKWPPAIAIVPIVIAILLFYPMKTIGKMAQEGATISEISATSSQIIRETMSGENSDQQIMDQLACTLTLVDRAERFYYGSTYFSLLTSPIPRQWWPNKPGLADHISEYSVPSRPMSELGMVSTFIGEFYLNFGYMGIVLMSYLTAYWLARVYFEAYRRNYYSVLRFGYLLIACNLIQVYRDGLMSLVIFTFINMMPLAVIVILHIMYPVRSKKVGATLYGAPFSPK